MLYKAQINNSDKNVVQEKKEKTMEESNVQIIVKQTQANEVTEVKKDDKDTPTDMVKKVISFADRGCEITKEQEDVYKLFSNIQTLSKNELLPTVESITDFENANDTLDKAGDILTKIINYSDKGFLITDKDDESEQMQVTTIVCTNRFITKDILHKLYIKYGFIECKEVMKIL